MNLYDHLKNTGVTPYPCGELNDFNRAIDISTGICTLYNIYQERIITAEEILDYYALEHSSTPTYDEQFLASILLNIGLPMNPPLGLLRENLKTAYKALRTAKKFQKTQNAEYHRILKGAKVC